MPYDDLLYILLLQFCLKHPSHSWQKLLYFSYKIIRICDDDLISPRLFYFTYHLPYLPGRKITGVIKKNETYFFQPFICIHEIMPGKFVRMITVYIGKTNRAP